ncbi:MAG: hypothetical protein PVH26_14590 [Desulfosarcina sp.]|jgi:hypothetical protein
MENPVEKVISYSSLVVTHPPRPLTFLMQFILHAALIHFIFSSTVFGMEHLSLATEIVQKAKNDCIQLDDGKFNATEQAITLHDLTGDGRPEEIVDASQFSCSTVASLWGGTGGTYLWMIVDGKTYEFLAHKWQVVDVDGQKVILLAVHSSECSDTIGPCYRALVWDDGFRTTR